MMGYSLDLLREKGLEPTMVLLLDRINKRATVTYGEIARMLPKAIGASTDTIIFPTHIGVVAGNLMDRIQKHSPSAPLINLLVVNAKVGLPSSGSYYYLDLYLGQERGTAARMPPQARKRLFQKLWQEVYAYSEWDKVFRTLFKHSPPSASEVGLEKFLEQDGKPGAWGGRKEGESVYHKCLKQHILDNPHLLSIRNVVEKGTEQKLLSGDSVDVFITTADVSYVIEVKSRISSDDDLMRGIYQCLKYRVVLAAQQKSDPDDGSVVAKLVVERNPPADLCELARRLKVGMHVVQVNVPTN